MMPGGFCDVLFNGFHGDFRGIGEMGYFMIDPVLKGGEKGKKILLFFQKLFDFAALWITFIHSLYHAFVYS